MIWDMRSDCYKNNQKGETVMLYIGIFYRYENFTKKDKEIHL